MRGECRLTALTPTKNEVNPALTILSSEATSQLARHHPHWRLLHDSCSRDIQHKQHRLCRSMSEVGYCDSFEHRKSTRSATGPSNNALISCARLS